MLKDKLKQLGEVLLDLMIRVAAARIDSKNESVLAASLFKLSSVIAAFVAGLVYADKRQRDANLRMKSRSEEVAREVFSLSPDAAADELRRDFSEP